MAEAIEDALGVTAELVEGDEGVFEVAVDGEVVFSKRQRGEFASTAEMVELVRMRLGEYD